MTHGIRRCSVREGTRAPRSASSRRGSPASRRSRRSPGADDGREEAPLSVTTVAVISDTHLPRGARALPDACLRRLSGADLILHAGDLVAVAVLEALEALGPPVLAVAGNVDAPALRERLPATCEADVGEVRVGMVHDAGPATGRLERLRRRFPGCDVVVFGHSHVPLHEVALEAGHPFAICNPGSPTDRRRQPHHTMGILSIDGADTGWELVRV